MIPIFNLFRTVFGWSSILVIIVPLIVSIIARRKGVKFTTDLRVFEFFIYVAVIGQLSYVILILTVGRFTDILRFVCLVETSAFVFLLLRWMNYQKYFSRLILLLISILFIGDYLLKTDYPDFMNWFEIIVFVVLSFLLSYKIDKNNISLPKEYSYIHIGIYLYSVIALIGFSPNGTELRMFGHLIHDIANLTSYYFFYRSFRCLYQ